MKYFKLYTLDNQFIEETNSWPSKFTGIIEFFGGTREWLLDGKHHRLDGPAFEGSDGMKSWFIDGIGITKEQCDLLHSIMKLKGLL